MRRRINNPSQHLKPQSSPSGTSRKQRVKFKSEKGRSYSKTKKVERKSLFFIFKKVKQAQSIKDGSQRNLAIKNLVLRYFCASRFRHVLENIWINRSLVELKREIKNEIATSKDKRKAIEKIVRQLKILQEEVGRAENRIAKLSYTLKAIKQYPEMAALVRHSLVQPLNRLAGNIALKLTTCNKMLYLHL